MSNSWSTHDAGFFTLEVPQGWVIEQPSTGSLILQDANAEVRLAINAVSRTAVAGRPMRPSALESQAELQQWVEEQSYVEVRQHPRIIPNARHAVAATEGLQRMTPPPQGAPKLPWIKRLLRWFRGGGLLLWRYWAVLNPHVLLLISCSGKPAAVERLRPELDHLIHSIELPDRDILIGRRFTETVVTLARSWFPQTAVTVIDDVHLQFGTKSVSLVNLHRRYLSSPDDLPTQVHAFLCSVQGELPASVAVGAWSSARERILPMFLSRAAVHNHPARLVQEPWVNDLAIVYILEDELPAAPPSAAPRAEPAGSPQAVMSKKRTMTADLKTQDTSQLLHAGERPITMEDLDRWNISPEDLHAQALQNLVLYSHEHTMQGQKGEGFTMLCLGGSAPGSGPATPGQSDRHNAARILLPELHRKLCEHLGKTFYAAIPTRELLLAFCSVDEEVIERVRDQVGVDYARSPNGLSPKLFLITPDGIAGDPADEEDLAL